MRPLATSALAHLALALLLSLSLLGCGGATPPKAADAPADQGTSATDDGAPAMPTGRLTEGAADAAQRQKDQVKELEAEAMRIETAKNAPPVDPNAPVAAAPAKDASGALAAFPDRNSIDPTNKYGVMKTTGGDIWFYFYPADAPNHVKNFIYLATKDFYRDVKFHRIVPDFVIQGGEARPDWMEPEVMINLEANKKRIHIPGALAAARTPDPNSATGQFYFVISRNAQTTNLDGDYTVYGQAFRGQEVINELGTSEGNTATAKILGCQIFEITPEIQAEIKTYQENHSIPE